MDIGKEIKRKRKEKGLTQVQLAEKLGVTSTAVAAWERGQYDPSAKVLLNVIQILDMVEVFFPWFKKDTEVIEVHGEHGHVSMSARMAYLENMVHALVAQNQPNNTHKPNNQSQNTDNAHQPPPTIDISTETDVTQSETADTITPNKKATFFCPNCGNPMGTSRSLEVKVGCNKCFHEFVPVDVLPHGSGRGSKRKAKKQ